MPTTSSLVEICYDYHQGPLTCEPQFLEGRLAVNCQLFAHMVLEALGYGLPKWLLSAEFFRRSAGGRVWVDRVDSINKIRRGDILLFAARRVRHIQDPLIYKLHLGVCLNPETQYIAHASRYLPNGQKDKTYGGIYQQFLYEIQSSPRYNTLVGIRRPLQ